MVPSKRLLGCRTVCLFTGEWCWFKTSSLTVLTKLTDLLTTNLEHSLHFSRETVRYLNSEVCNREAPFALQTHKIERVTPNCQRCVIAGLPAHKNHL